MPANYEISFAKKNNAIPLNIKAFDEEELRKHIKVVLSKIPEEELNGTFYRSCDIVMSGELNVNGNKIDLSGYGKKKPLKLCFANISSRVIVKQEERNGIDQRTCKLLVNLGVHDKDDELMIIRNNLSLIDKILHEQAVEIAKSLDIKRTKKYDRYKCISGFCKNANDVSKSALAKKISDERYKPNEESNNGLWLPVKYVKNKDTGNVYTSSIVMLTRPVKKISVNDFFNFDKYTFDSAVLIQADRVNLGYTHVEIEINEDEVVEEKHMKTMTIRFDANQIYILETPQLKTSDITVDALDIFGDIELEDVDITTLKDNASKITDSDDEDNNPILNHLENSSSVEKKQPTYSNKVSTKLKSSNVKKPKPFRGKSFVKQEIPLTEETYEEPEEDDEEIDDDDLDTDERAELNF